MVGGLCTLALTGGQPQPVAMAGGGFLLGLASVVYAWLTLRTADWRVLAGQGAREISGDEDDGTRRLWNVTAEMALASGMPMPRVFVIEEAGLNAFAVGRDPSGAAVAATRGLIDALSRDELQAVMAHEVAHIAGQDTRLMVAAAATAGVTLMAVDVMHSVLRGTDSRKLGAAALIGYVAALAVASIVVPLLQMALSRQREYLADANAAKFTRNPAALASALERITENPRVSRADHAVAGMYIANPCEPSALDSLMSTHPPAKRRIARLLDLR